MDDSPWTSCGLTFQQSHQATSSLVEAVSPTADNFSFVRTAITSRKRMNPPLQIFVVPLYSSSSWTLKMDTYAAPHSLTVGTLFFPCWENEIC